MDLERRRKEEFEIDPNSAFNKLKKLQRTLKEEIALKDIFNKNKEEMMNKINNLGHKYFKAVVESKEQYDNAYNFVQNKGESYLPKSYSLAENSQCILPQCIDPLTKLLFYFRDDYDKILNLIDNCEGKIDDFAFFLSHCFYENLFSSDTVSDRLLILIYFLLEKDIDKLTTQNSSLSFLNESLLSRIFRNLTRKEDIKSYLRIILNSAIVKLENEKDAYACFDFNRIKENSKDQSITRSKTTPVHSKQLSEFNTEQYDNLLFDNKPSKTSNHHSENKKKLNLLIYNDEEINNNYLLINKSEDRISKLGFEKLNIDDGQNQQFDAKEAEDSAFSDLTKEKLEIILAKTEDPIMQEYISKQLEQFDNNPNIYTSIKLVKNINNSGCSEKMFHVYKSSFILIKDVIDEIFTNLIDNISLIPNSIKCICLIISKLLKIKFPGISTMSMYLFIGKFFLNEIIFPILYNPLFNGIITSTIISNKTMDKVVIISKIFKNIIKGQLFNETKDNEYWFTIFNRFILDIMPSLLMFFDNLTQSVLPGCIEQLILEKEKGYENRTTSYDYFKEHSNEKMEHQSLCFTWSDFLLFYDIIQKKKDIFIFDPKNLFSKTFKKLTFHENVLRNKVDIDSKNNKKTYLLVTNIHYSKEFELKIDSLSKQEKFSFESSETSENINNEKCILARVKYCISTIIRQLNILTRANFFIDASESTENFVIGLNKMIELEGFSEMLKEKTIPLAWFGLYLQSNIENIPVPHRRANYFQLYEELLKDSYKNLDIIQKDESLNHIFLKVQNCRTKKNIIKNSLNNLTKMNKIIKMNHIFLSISVPVIIKKIFLKKELIKIEVILKELNQSKFEFFAKTKTIDTLCNTITEFADNFPKLKNYLTSDTILATQEKIMVNQAIESYIDIINNVIDKRQFVTSSDIEQKDSIKDNIIIMIQKLLYDKIFPEKQSKLDIDLELNCQALELIEKDNFPKKFPTINNQLIESCVKYIKYMEIAKCPQEKLEVLSKIRSLILTNIFFYTGVNDIKYEDMIDIIAYMVLKAKPSHFYSNAGYIELYMSKGKKQAWTQMIDLFNNVKNRAKGINIAEFTVKEGEEIGEKVEELK